MAVPASISTIPTTVSLALLSCFEGSYFGHTVASHSRTQGSQIHDSKYTLSAENVFAFIRDEV